MSGTWRSFAARWLDALLPTGCIVCARPVSTRSLGTPGAFCPACVSALPWWRRADGCPRCGERHPAVSGCPGCLSVASPLQTSHTALRYAGPVARWIPAYKRRDARPAPAVTRAIDALGEALANRITPDLRGYVDFVLPVPLHATRLRERGFNQADELAARLAGHLRVPFRSDVLERTRATRAQASLRGEERRRNVFGAFRVRGERLADARIALIDDVLTTGATLEAAAGVLLEAGALEVRAVTLAATLPETRLAPRNSGRTVTGGPGPRPLSSGALADRGRPGGFRERQDPTEPIHSGAAHARSPRSESQE